MSRRYARSGGASGSLLVAEASPITITGGAAHAKGSWVDLFASVAENSMALGLFTTEDIFVGGTDTSILLDIGIGSTGDAVDATVVSNITVGYRRGYQSICLPLFFRKGERIAARIQGTQASETFVVRPWLEYAPPPPMWAGFSVCETISAIDLASSTATMGDFANNAFEEIIASTVNPYKAVSFFPACFGSGAGAAEFTVDLGVGGAGSETVIGQWRVETGANEVVQNDFLPHHLCVNIPAGSRLAVRKNATATASGVFVGWR